VEYLLTIIDIVTPLSCR